MRRVASWLGRQKELELRQNTQKKRRIPSLRAFELSLLHGLVQLIANLRRYPAVARSWARRAADSAGGTGARDRSSTARRIPNTAVRSRLSQFQGDRESRRRALRGPGSHPAVRRLLRVSPRDPGRCTENRSTRTPQANLSRAIRWAEYTNIPDLILV
jgi:hypothetical protein